MACGDITIPFKDLIVLILECFCFALTQLVTSKSFEVILISYYI